MIIMISSWSWTKHFAFPCCYRRTFIGYYTQISSKSVISFLVFQLGTVNIWILSPRLVKSRSVERSYGSFTNANYVKNLIQSVKWNQSTVTATGPLASKVSFRFCVDTKLTLSLQQKMVHERANNDDEQ